jgi:hypothetical protein
MTRRTVLELGLRWLCTLFIRPIVVAHGRLHEHGYTPKSRRCCKHRNRVHIQCVFISIVALIVDTATGIDNLPNEIKFLLSEIQYKDMKCNGMVSQFIFHLIVSICPLQS